MKTKTFDCMEMKRRGADALRKRLAVMTAEQERAFWAQRSEALRTRQAQRRASRDAEE